MERPLPSGRTGLGHGKAQGTAGEPEGVVGSNGGWWGGRGQGSRSDTEADVRAAGRGVGVGREGASRWPVFRTLLSLSFFPGRSNERLMQQWGYLVWLTQGRRRENACDLSVKVARVRPCRRP